MHTLNLNVHSMSNKKRNCMKKTILLLLLLTIFKLNSNGQCNDSLLYSAVSPFPVTMTNIGHLSEFSAALDSIASRIPAIKYLMLGFENLHSDTSDWISILNICNQKGFKVIVIFMDSIYNSGNPTTEQLRPVFSGSNFNFESLGNFVSCQRCITHPALYAVWMIDEPWHPTKLPKYTTDTLKMMYTQLKSLAAPNNFKIFAAFSRQIWTRTWSGQGLGGQGGDSLITWRDSLCDIVQISTLEFQNNGYGWTNLDNNHYYSRYIIDSITPTLPLFTSIQVFGGNLGPNAGYWYPYPNDLIQLMDSVTDSKYQNVYPLTGMTFQQWDSPLLGQRSGQYTLGDIAISGSSDSQTAASQNLINAINQWIAPCVTSKVERFGSEIPESYVLFQNFPNPFNPSTTIRFGVPVRSRVTLILFDVLGRQLTQLLDETLETGYHQREWHAQLASGIYFYRIQAFALDDPQRTFAQTKRLLLLR